MALVEHFVHFEFSNRIASGWCNVKLYRSLNNIQIAIITEPIDSNGDYANHGLSVTNAVDNIVYKLSTQHDFTPDVVVEHYPTRHEAFQRQRKGLSLPKYGFLGGEEDYSLVFMKNNNQSSVINNPFNNTRWLHIKYETVCDLIKEKFPKWDYGIIDNNTEISED